MGNLTAHPLCHFLIGNQAWPKPPEKTHEYKSMSFTQTKLTARRQP
jgi:hypothetical protein